MNILYGDRFDYSKIGSWSVHNFEILKGLSHLGHTVILMNGKTFGKDMVIATNNQPSSKKHSRGRVFWKNLFGSHRVEITILRHILIEIRTVLSIFIIIIVQKGRIDVIYRRNTAFNSEYFVAKLFGIPLVKEVNGIAVYEVMTTKKASSVFVWITDKVERFNIPKADKIMTVTQELKNTICNEYKVPESKVTVVSNGVDTDLFKPIDSDEAKKRLSLNQSYNYICFTGGFYPWQGIENLIKSATLVLQKCPDTKFLLVGDGQIKQELMELAQRMGIADKIIFTGMVAYQMVPLYINASDICVIPAAMTKRNVQMGGGASLKIHEYMACGKPIVTNRYEGSDLDVAVCHIGVAVNTEDCEELAKTLVTLLKDRLLGLEMGKRGRALAVEKYTWIQKAEQVVEVFENVVGKRREKPI